MEFNQSEKEDIKIWVEELRSGRYKQTRETLEDQHGFCCLGVGCKIFIKDNLKDVDNEGMLTGGMPSEQPRSPRWLKEIENYKFGANRYLISELNDSCGKSFEEIADIIENEFLK